MSAHGASQEALSERNFRRFAQEAIAAYERKGMLVDALLWSSIIGYYDAALEVAEGDGRNA